MAKKPTSASTRKTSARKTKKAKPKLAMVVHGIGEQSEGESIDALVGAWAGDQRLRMHSHTRHLREVYWGDTREKKTFPCHVRHIERPYAQDIVFAEVYWADISSGAKGAVSSIIEVLKLVLGLGYVVRDNAAERNSGRILQWMAWAFVLLLHGPILSLMLIYSMYLLSFFGLGWLGKEGRVFAEFTEYTVACAWGFAAIVAIAVPLIFKLRGRGVLFALFLRWLFIMGALALLWLLFLIFFQKVETDLEMSFEISSGYLLSQQILWFVEVSLVFGLILFQGLFDLFASRRERQLTLYPITCALMCLLFLIIGTMYWAVLLTFIEQFNVRHEILNPEEVGDLINQLTSVSTIAWAAFAILIAASIIVVVGRARAVARHNSIKHKDPKEAQKHLQTSRIQRLIINDGIYWALTIAGVFLFAGFVIALNISATQAFTGWPIRDFFEWAGREFAMTIGALTIAIYPMIWKKVAGGIGTGKDIVGYFAVAHKKDLRHVPEISHDRIIEIPENLDPNNKYRPLFRERINYRFKTVLHRMAQDYDVDEIIVISHSQGTVVSFESLREGALKSAGIKDCKLVTMGSPLWHIYNRHFPTRMKTLLEPIQNVSEWINIYRVDDYVGKWLGNPDGEYPKNRPVPPKGHLGYWSDREVLEILSKEVF